MVGIVGPNGCGKSNIIDAVRWVMGESSRHLRGITMEDVIFNGSSARSPSGQASVELVFDNREGKLGGQYSSYNEISVRRQVVRDGQSKYYLNGTRCRRRDIVDLFLGTGLGPNSYAIIEQGMISRLIDTKPDELRVYLEEAAGISKYKERRRETENRIRHTCENLERLNDVMEEISKRIGHLKRQARAAEHYKMLRENERQAGNELLALRWQAQQERVETLRQSVAHKKTEIEKAVAEIRAIEAEMAALRLRRGEEEERISSIQGEYYRLGGEISRVEQAIRHAREMSDRYGEELGQVHESQARVESAFKEDQAKVGRLQARIDEIEPQLEAAREMLEAHSEDLDEAESNMASWQRAWEALMAKMAGPGQAQEIEASRIRYLESQLEQLTGRRARLASDLEQHASRLQPDETTAEAGVSETGAACQELSALLDRLTGRISEGRTASQRLVDQVQEARGNLQDLQVRHASLLAMQKVVSGEEQAVSHWLESQGLVDAPRLMQTIRTEPGWERAVETVLSECLQAVCVEDIEQVAASCGRIETGHLFMLESGSSAASAMASDTLVSKVQAPVDLSEFLENIHIAEDLQGALARRKRLGPGQSVITREGIWMGGNWIRIARVAADQGNVLQRKRDIELLEGKISSQDGLVTDLTSELEACREKLGEDERKRDDAQARLDAAREAHAGARAELASLQQERTHAQQLQDYSEEVDHQISRAQEELDRSKASRIQAESALGELEGERDSLRLQRDAIVSSLDSARSTQAASRESAHQLALELQSSRSSLQATHEALARMQEQTVQLQERTASLMAATEESDAPLGGMESQLKEYVEQRTEVNHNLAEARNVLHATDETIRGRQETLMVIQGRQETLKEELGNAQLAWQEANVRSKTIEEQLEDHETSIESIVQALPADAEVPEWEEKVQSIAQKIARLGPINLAAISEFEEHSERKEYLDRQQDDLKKALETLERAIRKIDKETQDRFKDIFDRVNQHLQDMYPRLFGGGKAFLEMTGDDLLTTGISVMARPPGKRLTSIHLLSGGEKALTAVALIFSLFELNPAPFCLLDEVDAPLDEANVTRYCELLKDMSEQVQFISITHNKSTMEYASQLLGITMNEPGVSRVVSVDIDEAAEMHAAS